jgi:hypothetical protein
MTLAAPERIRFRLADHLETLVWVPSSGTEADVLELYLLLSPSGRLPALETVSDGWRMPAATKAAAQRAVILARGHGVDARWTEERSSGQRAFPIARFVLGELGRDRMLRRLDQVRCGWEQETNQPHRAGDRATARSVWRAVLLAYSHSRNSDASVIAQFAHPHEADWACAGAEALGVRATVMPSRRRNQVHLAATDARALVARLVDQ